MADGIARIENGTLRVTVAWVDLIGSFVAAASGSATASAASAALASRYANDATNTDVVGGAVGDRGAKYYRDLAAAAVAATREPFGVEIYNGGSAIAQGVYNGDYNAASGFTVNRFTAVMEDATAGATANITALVNDVAVYGPVTVTFGTTLATTPSYAIPSGGADTYLVELMTGTVRKLYIRADGVPA